MSCSHRSSQNFSMFGEENPLDLDVKKYVLDNGLRVLIVENHKLPIYSYYTFFDVGGKNEVSGNTGSTHFLEHMMFKGGGKFGAGIFDSYIESQGGSTNAYTSFDSTVYYENLPSLTLPKIVDFEADRMSHVLLDPAAFNKEKNVVLEERKLRYENSPKGKLFLNMMQSIYYKTPYGGSVIGDKKDVIALTPEILRSFYKLYYVPNNAIVVIVGDVDADKTIALIKEKFGSIARNSGLAKLKEDGDKASRYQSHAKLNRNVEVHSTNPNPIFMMAYQGDKLGAANSYVLDILSSILGDGASSYLNQKYVLGKRPALSNIYAANYSLKHSGVFFIGGELLKQTRFKKFRKKIVRDSSRFCHGPLTERNLQKTKNQYLIHYFNALETNAGVASFIGTTENIYGDYRFYKKELDIYNAITLDQVKSACLKLFKAKNQIFVSVWNKHKAKK